MNMHHQHTSRGPRGPQHPNKFGVCRSDLARRWHFSWMLPLVGMLVAAGCGAESGSSSSGTWTGLIGEGTARPIGIRFVLEEENGKLAGRTFVQDQDAEEYAIEAALAGTRDGASATWTTETDVVIEGKFEDNNFWGTIRFPADDGDPPTIAPLRLSR